MNFDLRSSVNSSSDSLVGGLGVDTGVFSFFIDGLLAAGLRLLAAKLCSHGTEGVAGFGVGVCCKVFTGFHVFVECLGEPCGFFFGELPGAGPSDILPVLAIGAGGFLAQGVVVDGFTDGFDNGFVAVDGGASGGSGFVVGGDDAGAGEDASEDGASAGGTRVRVRGRHVEEGFEDLGL